MKSRIFGHRDRTLAVIAIALGTVVDAYLGRALLVKGCRWWGANYQAAAPLGNWIGGGVAAWVALSQLKIARKRHDQQVKRDEEQTSADKQRRIQESFTKAVEQLGSDKLRVRLGGIYALERIYMRESPEDYWMIMETLTAFVREWALLRLESGEKDSNIPPTDVAAILSVIKRRPSWALKIEISTESRLDFRGTNFRELSLTQTNFSHADFTSANLAGASLLLVNLAHAILNFTDFTNANLAYADFTNASLMSAKLTRARLHGAKLSKANLQDSELNDTNLFRADLTGAILLGANLTNARLVETNLVGTILDYVTFDGADLSAAKNLSSKQLESATGNRATKLPKGMSYPNTWLQD
jgi:uncharacterized protein YjbI with pentapeptide repeats